jgi:hypothetical protein
MYILMQATPPAYPIVPISDLSECAVIDYIQERVSEYRNGSHHSNAKSFIYWDITFCYPNIVI